jgi:hypothetical protein
MGLAQDAAQSAHRDFGFPGNDRGVHGIAVSSHEFNVAAFLADFDETSGFESAEA